MASTSCLCLWLSSARWRSSLRRSSLFLPMSTSCAALLTVRLLVSSLSLLMSRLFSPLAPCKPLMRRSRAFSRLEVSLETLAWCRSTPSTRSLISLCKSSSCFLRSASVLLRRVSMVAWLASILLCISWWISECFVAIASKFRQCSALSSKLLAVLWWLSSICRMVFVWLVSTLSSRCFTSPRIWFSDSSTFLLRLSTSSRRAEAMSRTVLMEESMSSFMSFQATMSVLASSLAWVWSRSSAMSSESWWQRSWASWRLCETSSIQASCALSASCMSPMSRRMVEISAVTVASTRCLEVMMECVESTRARISSRSTLTASMAAVKSSMSRSHARTMRFTCAVSLFWPFNRSFSSPTSYFTASRS
mmetsp:Transcript_16952/g.53266  ORF Transcript_16952/g.53266 Transcript_16952/m.53266 type:complete len:363 (-) Transcript_16952:18-1106(-)